MDKTEIQNILKDISKMRGNGVMGTLHILSGGRINFLLGKNMETVDEHN